jgi:FAD/FMN-containing dehydrogenase
LLISLREMNGVRVNADGALNRDLIGLLPSHRIMIPSGRCPTVTVGGFILGGGFGFSSRYLGLAVDKLVSTKLVTADGKLITVDADNNPDLSCALRGGGGGNFGASATAWPPPR